MAQGANDYSGIHPFEMQKQGDVRKETTAASLSESQWLGNKSSDTRNVFKTDPSNYIRHQGQESYTELEMYENTKHKI